MPWFLEGFAKEHELAARCSGVAIYQMWVLSRLAEHCKSVEGDFIECGVAAGGTAMMISGHMGSKKLHLFDTFKGLPSVDPKEDLHAEGEMAVSLEECQGNVSGNVEWHPGLIPETFRGFARRFAFAHIDVDLYRSVLDCCEFIYPRMNPGGVMVFDDYADPTCPGARKAVDGFFSDKPEVPLQMFGTSCVVHRLGSRPLS